jgi:hypothetical protein
MRLTARWLLYNATYLSFARPSARHGLSLAVDRYGGN